MPTINQPGELSNSPPPTTNYHPLPPHSVVAFNFHDSSMTFHDLLSYFPMTRIYAIFKHAATILERNGVIYDSGSHHEGDPRVPPPENFGKNVHDALYCSLMHKKE